MLLRELTYSMTEEMDPEIAKASLAVLQAIDTSSSQWRKTKKGSIRTQELEDLQVMLKELGYNPGKPDGWFGRKTARAVMEFQKDNNLKVDGDPGKNTINKLIDVVEKELYGDENDDIEISYLDDPSVDYKTGDFDLDKITTIAKRAIDSAEAVELDEKQVWAKSGQKVVRKYRCTAGSRKGRVVKEPAQCFRAPDVKRRIQLKKTKARMGARMARKAKRTKRVSPVSRRVAQLNKATRRR